MNTCGLIMMWNLATFFIKHNLQKYVLSILQTLVFKTQPENKLLFFIIKLYQTCYTFNFKHNIFILLKGQKDQLPSYI